MKEKYAPILLSAKGKTLVFIGTAVLFATGIYGATQVERDGYTTLREIANGARSHAEI